ncbi:hypothetical protein P20311_2120 [Pseudoalteromonas sp. BSi20311]|jgi:hypothetical protein|uniref:hypothetical protein n=1 Tax=unclassified Pseudoalteromonas TaxID=194690 RepID=UPI000231A1C8|nr:MULTISPECIES: hypothetical protein [unclassified Pseudoalteromonas]QBJ64574.1 hypothetical protein B1F84_16080 [Pseudoalteromonas sp. DL-6]GAA64325.1 hypothetical protein P20311_2120 [Pseudoalteromonas sp. BSi20311]GAA72024.1 hypothetical protein P20439_2106 [Pseudoalteromonas sp. BSi20439]HCP97340.1 hypothetical protein [Pseudoalteromonas sp.]|tara:strand:- start:5 stop:283 length:279 start_codon:yes stop_codon:yes gene_type:complete
MKTSINMTIASLLVLGSTQVNATEVDLNITDMLTKTVSTYVSQASNELEKSVKEAVSFDAQLILDGLLETNPVVNNNNMDEKQRVVKAQPKQ